MGTEPSKPRSPSISVDETHVARLQRDISQLPAMQSSEILASEADVAIVRVLSGVSPAAAVKVLWSLDDDRRERVLATAQPERAEQWRRNHTYPDETIGRLMEHPVAIFTPETTVEETIERLRDMVSRAFVTYGWVTDAEGRLLGLVVFRELLFARKDQPLSDIMLGDPFALRPDTLVADAMREALPRHFPVYPVKDEQGRLVGIVRGQSLFEQQAVELSAQPGNMVGVDREERLATPWQRSLKLRHPWLQLNLLTAFVAAGVVGVFQSTIDRVVVLALFLPVLAGQSGNTGCQALAVTLRAMTLGELSDDKRKLVLVKEALLGLLNGVLVGVTAGLGMYVVSAGQGRGDALMLGVVVCIAMIGACIVSGCAGALVPMVLRRLGADPATASSIFLTTASDVVSMGLFLGLAALLI